MSMPSQAAALAATGVVAVLCPTASWSMQSPQAPGPLLWDRGVTVALATDCNPGTSYVESMQLVVAVACLEMGLRLEEAVWSATRGGALASGRGRTRVESSPERSPTCSSWRRIAIATWPTDPTPIWSEPL